MTHDVQADCAGVSFKGQVYPFSTICAFFLHVTDVSTNSVYTHQEIKLVLHLVNEPKLKRVFLEASSRQREEHDELIAQARRLRDHRAVKLKEKLAAGETVVFEGYGRGLFVEVSPEAITVFYDTGGKFVVTSILEEPAHIILSDGTYSEQLSILSVSDYDLLRDHCRNRPGYSYRLRKPPLIPERWSNRLYWTAVVVMVSLTLNDMFDFFPSANDLFELATFVSEMMCIGAAVHLVFWFLHSRKERERNRFDW